ncbi:MAG: DUF3137 domain-containing protein [Bdellovibrionota bacterium]
MDAFLSLKGVEGVVFVLTTLATAYFASVAYRKYVKALRSSVVRTVARSVLSKFTYAGEQYVSLERFTASKLFGEWNNFSGNDLLTGEVGGFAFESSELNVSKTSGSGRSRSTKVIFKGIFFALDFGVAAPTEIFIQPDTLEKRLGSFGRVLQEKIHSLKGHELVLMPNSDFERHFVVSSPEADRIGTQLNGDFLKVLMDLVHRFDCPIHASFVGTRLYVGLESSSDFFVPSLWKTLSEAHVSSVAMSLRDLVAHAERLAQSQSHACRAA